MIITMKKALPLFLVSLIAASISAQEWNPRHPGWTDSHEANGFCWCNTTNFDHNLDEKSIVINGVEVNIVVVCEELEKHPLYRAYQDGDAPYNDIQCGNGPPNDAADEVGCPGRTDLGPDGCDQIGPTFDIAWLETRFGPQESVCGETNTPQDPPDQNNNLALGKNTSQSSTTHSGDSSRAVDGNTNGSYSNNSVTHTAEGIGEWWQVDLGDVYSIEDIVIFNRTDNCCESRLGDFTVSLSNASDGSQVLWSNTITDAPDPDITMKANDTSGRYISCLL